MWFMCLSGETFAGTCIPGASQPGKPLFVSALVYLNSSWPMEHDAETLAVDIDTDTGVFVRPQPGRVVLMDQVTTATIAASCPCKTEAGP